MEKGNLLGSVAVIKGDAAHRWWKTYLRNSRVKVNRMVMGRLWVISKKAVSEAFPNTWLRKVSEAVTFSKTATQDDLSALEGKGKA